MPGDREDWTKNPITQEITATYLKMQLALEQLPWATPTVTEAMHRWMGEMLSPVTFFWKTAVEFGVSLSADLRRLTWRVTDTPEDFIPRLADYFEKADISEREMDRIAHIGEVIQPSRLGAWFEVLDTTFNAGWVFPVDIPFAQALTYTESSQARDQLAAWAEQHEVTTCTRLGRAVGAGNPYTELQLRLPGEEIEQQIEVGSSAFSALQVPQPPAAAWVALRNWGNSSLTTQPGMSLSIWLSATGVVKVGLLVTCPSTRFVIQLCRAASLKPGETLAAFEGALDVKGPAHIEGQQLSHGFGVECHYTLKE